MVPDGLFVIAQKIGNVGNRHTSLEKNSSKRMAESVGCRILVERSCQFKDLVHSSAPQVGQSFQPIRLANRERAGSVML